MSKILIVIPYLASAAQGRELEYAIAGWRKHFKEDYKIVLTGEILPKIPGRDVVRVESKRIAPIQGQYRQHLDYVSCFMKVRKKFPDSDGFIFVADDCYAVNDFDMTEVRLLKMEKAMIDYDPMSPNMWKQDALKTAKVLHDGGYPTRDFTTHLPQWFEWDKIEALWNKYDMLHNSYVIEDLYYNTFERDRIPLCLSDGPNNFKFTVQITRPSAEAIRHAIRTKIWINNNPDGWCPELENALKDHFGI